MYTFYKIHSLYCASSLQPDDTEPLYTRLRGYHKTDTLVVQLKKKIKKSLLLVGHLIS